MPRQLLHPRIEARTYFAFIRGEYDTAIFQAFKEVEIAVRDNATGVDEKHYGVTLIRAAFHPKTGPLRDEYATEAEREALMNLMAGALGLYKNPHSHKEVRVSPREAIEMILIANHLLNIVEWRVVMS